MNRKTCLVHVPGHPLRMDDLMPQSLLARLAAVLLQEGVPVSIVDTGEPESIVDPACVEASRSAFLPGVERALREALSSEPALVVLQVLHRKDVPSVRQTAALVKKHRPETCVLLTGGYAEAYGPVLVEADANLDAAILYDPEVVLAEWGSSPDDKPLSEYPNLAMMRDGQTRRGRRALARQLDRLPLPDYSSATYPAIYQGKKLHLFEIEHVRGGGGAPLGPIAPWSAMPLRVKSPSVCVREIEHIRHCVPTAAALHFSGAGASAQAIEHLCYELRGLDRPVRYSRDAQVGEMETLSPHSLHASGCRVLRMPLYTGSQRLLEDFFGQSHGVSQAERALQRAQRAQLFRIAEFTYPVPHDDHHTRAETLRLISRVMPEAVSVAPAELRPESVWSDWQEAYGFQIDEHAYRAWVAPDSVMNPGVQPYRMAGWTKERMLSERDGLLQDAASLGVYAGMSACEGLVAWELELEECLDRFSLLQHEALRHADSASNLVRIFNERSGLPASKVAWFPFQHQLKAASN